MRCGWQALIIAAVCCTTCVARAEPVDPSRLAVLLRTGAEASNAKRWTACIEALTAAVTIDPASKTVGDLGLCEEQAGRFVAAHDHLFRALEAAPTQPTREPWSRYHAALARVKERVALLVVSTSPPNARVILDGRPLGPADGRAFAVEPGKHTIGARLAGYEDVVETRTMRARDMPAFHFQLKAKAPSAAGSAAGTTMRTPSTSSSTPTTSNSGSSAFSSVHPVAPKPPLGPLFMPGLSPRGFVVGLTYVGAVTVLAGAGTWIGLELDRASLRSKVSGTACGPAATSPLAICDQLAERHQQRDTAALFTVTAGATTAVLAMSSVIAIHAEWAAGRASITPVVNQGGGGVVLGGAW